MTFLDLLVLAVFLSACWFQYKNWDQYAGVVLLATSVLATMTALLGYKMTPEEVFLKGVFVLGAGLIAPDLLKDRWWRTRFFFALAAYVILRYYWGPAKGVLGTLMFFGVLVTGVAVMFNVRVPWWRT